MPILLDHTIVPAYDNEASARFIARIFGWKFEAPVSNFMPDRVDGTLVVDLDRRATFELHHDAFKLSGPNFDAIFQWIEREGIACDSGPRSGDYMAINRRGAGRGLHFKVPNGPLLDVLDGLRRMRPFVVTVFGATGFLGRHIVRWLHARGCVVRIASRHPDQGGALFGTDDPRLRPIGADIQDRQSVADAVAGAHAAVNAVSLYTERGAETFHAVHVECAELVATEAYCAGIEQLVHVSGIGADPASGSPYVRSRGEGELAVRAAYPGAVLVRPAVMFGPDDAFLTVILKLLQRLPAYPMFGSGTTKLQPAHVEDAADAIARVLQRTERDPKTLECGGPRVYTYKELLRSIAGEAGRKPILFPVPFAVWSAMARTVAFLPSPPITPNQVELMQIDTVASPQLPGFADLGILPQPLEETVRLMVRNR